MKVTNKCKDCPNPGCCCNNFSLFIKKEPWAYTAIETKAQVIKRLKESGLPFKPLKKNKVYWKFSCPKLKDGRCLIYDKRPETCKKYKPGYGDLCCLSKTYQLKYTPKKMEQTTMLDGRIYEIKWSIAENKWVTYDENSKRVVWSSKGEWITRRI